MHFNSQNGHTPADTCKEAAWNSLQISIIYNLFASDVCAVDFFIV